MFNEIINTTTIGNNLFKCGNNRNPNITPLVIWSSLHSNLCNNNTVSMFTNNKV